MRKKLTRGEKNMLVFTLILASKNFGVLVKFQECHLLVHSLHPPSNRRNFADQQYQQNNSKYVRLEKCAFLHIVPSRRALESSCHGKLDLTFFCPLKISWPHARKY